MTVITRGAALRIALAARALEGVDLRAFTVGLADRLAERHGLPIDEDKLSSVTVTEIKRLLVGEDTVENVVEPDQDMASIKLAVRYLWGENDAGADMPVPESPLDRPDSLRVAVASNTAENLDGHFGSAPRFLIYQVDKTLIRLIDVRTTFDADASEDRNTARAALIGDCHILYVQSIGGPAVAKVVRVGVHPIKVATATPARKAIARIQTVLDAPPPWLARAMGVEAKSLTRFSTEAVQA